MDIASCFKIGWIVKPHGLKGEVTAMLESDAPSDLRPTASIFIEQNKRLIPYFIQSISVNGRKAFIKFEDVDSPEAASRIARQALYVPKTMRPKSGRGEFYPDEIIDFEVHDDQKGMLGKIREVIQAGPNQLLLLEYQNKEVLIPINGPFITGVNKTEKQIKVELPEGFLDL